MKFSIRDLLLVTVIVALAVGWWLDRSYLAQENFRHEMQERLRNSPPLHIGRFKTLEGFDDPDIYPPDLPNSSAPALNPPKP